MGANGLSPEFQTVNIYEASIARDWAGGIWDAGLQVGVDEVGIGPLAGPVTAGAVVLDPTRHIAGLADSKALSGKRRVALADEIKQYSLAWSLGWANVTEIDTLNILQASHLAMRRAIAGLSHAPTLVLIDGNKAPAMETPVVTVIQGDRKIPQISAASILAKVARDRVMCELHNKWPEYGFERHKGYPTSQHMAALQQHGATPQHRRSFAPVRKALANVRSQSAADAPPPEVVT